MHTSLREQAQGGGEVCPLSVSFFPFFFGSFFSFLLFFVFFINSCLPAADHHEHPVMAQTVANERERVQTHTSANRCDATTHECARIQAGTKWRRGGGPPIH